MKYGQCSLYRVPRNRLFIFIHSMCWLVPVGLVRYPVFLNALGFHDVHLESRQLRLVGYGLNVGGLGVFLLVLLVSRRTLVVHSLEGLGPNSMNKKFARVLARKTALYLNLLRLAISFFILRRV